MVFSSPVFLFLFLPIVICIYFFLRNNAARNIFLLLASLFFYAWGEISFVWVMLFSIALNYVLAILISNASRALARKLLLAMAVFINIGILATFKYAAFLVENLNSLRHLIHRHELAVPTIALPLGISFFTFHALSYVIDVYRGQAKAQRNPINLALYISFFPQLIAGPIIRYHDVCDQLTQRDATVDKFAQGVRRFVTGLGKKMLIANTVAMAADKIFALPLNEVSPYMAWLGALSYTLQIYFDFSGYSDMAIGLGLIFGFRFLENFNYPYIAQSVREFWQRWHISLSNWFRDYLYIPLGGNRKGEARTCLNLLLVFFLCGLWHGASWTFVIWGLYHGLFLGLERLGWGKLLAMLTQPLRHAYTLLVVMIGWVFFRAESFQQAMTFIAAMFGRCDASAYNYSFASATVLDTRIVFIMLFGIIASTPIFRKLIFKTENVGGISEPPKESSWSLRIAVIRTAAISTIFALSTLEMISGTYNPFIYFRF